MPAFQLQHLTQPLTILQPFRASPARYRRVGLPGHSGIDLARPRGADVRAPADGIVTTTANTSSEHGAWVQLTHPAHGYLTVYGNLDDIRVSPGQHVQAGDVLGTVGGSGPVTDQPHLHIGLRTLDAPETWLDPLLFLPVSLMPDDSTDAGNTDTGTTAHISVSTPPPDPTDTQTAPGAPAPLTGRVQLTQQDNHTHLSIDADTSPRLGVNVRELAYFGTPRFKWAKSAFQDDFMAEASRLGMTWVRFYAAMNDADPAATVKRVRAALDTVAEHGLLAVVVIADSIGVSGFYPGGDDPYHREDMGHLHKSYWHDRAYRTDYLPLVKKLAGALHDHPGLGMWQLMNEPAIYPQPASPADADAFAQFVDEAAAAIYALDTQHPISVGIINAAHIAPPGVNLPTFAADFYRARKYIHVVSCHAYQHANAGVDALWDQEARADADVHAAGQTGRAFVWTEFGASQSGNRTTATEKFLQRQFDRNPSSAALQWGFMPTEQDVGVGDHDFGFSPASFNREYKQLGTLFRVLANRLRQG